MESASSGILAGINAVNRKYGTSALILPKETMMGALSDHVANSVSKTFSLWGANFGVLPALSEHIKDKRALRCLGTAFTESIGTICVN